MATRGVRAGSWSALSVLAATVVLLPAACHRPPSPAPSPPAPQAPADVVVLGDVDPTIRTDIRYATERNFVGRPLEGYREPLCLLTRAAADALRRVQAAALTHGHTVKVYDCYRPGSAADDILRWARDPGETPTGRTYHPRLSKSDLFAQGYLAAPTAHSRGSTVDLTLVRLPTSSPPPVSPAPAAPSASGRGSGAGAGACTAPRAQRSADDSVDMGTGFDCFDPLSATDAAAIPAVARENRALLLRLMTEGGFVNYPREWWHYRLSDEPYPDTYFDFPVSRAAVR